MRAGSVRNATLMRSDAAPAGAFVASMCVAGSGTPVAMPTLTASPRSGRAARTTEISTAFVYEEGFHAVVASNGAAAPPLWDTHACVASANSSAHSAPVVSPPIARAR